MSERPRDAGRDTHARIRTLRLRVPGTDVRSAKALASAVASQLALRAGELRGGAGQETIRATVRSPAATSRESLTNSIVDAITKRRAAGGRED